MGKFTNLNRIKEQAKLIETLADRVNGDTVRHCEALKDYPYYSLPTGVPRKNADTGGHYALAAGTACAVKNAG